MKVEFTTHALERARTRAPHLGLKAIAREVDDAIYKGRISDEPPSWRMGRNGDSYGPGIEYAWTPDRSRVYVLAERRRDYVLLVTIVQGIRAAA